jgi:hypothetical protein
LNYKGKIDSSLDEIIKKPWLNFIEGFF